MKSRYLIFSSQSFRGFDMELIPVVLGGANYTKLLPPHSFIDVRDYESPKHLAKYLLHLVKHPTEYMEYFAWKQNYRLLKTVIVRRRGFCQLCEMLHDRHRIYKSSFNITDYWNHNKDCLEGTAEYKEVHLL